jgi:hypothetical protein
MVQTPCTNEDTGYHFSKTMGIMYLCSYQKYHAEILTNYHSSLQIMKYHSQTPKHRISLDTGFTKYHSRLISQIITRHGITKYHSNMTSSIITRGWRTRNHVAKGSWEWESKPASDKQGTSTGERNERLIERPTSAREQPRQRPARQTRNRQQKERSNSASGTAGRASARERNELYSERSGGQGIEKRKKRAIEREARRACRRQDKQTSDSASGAAGVLSAGERNSDSASSAAGVSSARERNGRFSDRRGGRVIGGRKKQRFSKRRGGQGVGKRKKRAIQRTARRACYRREKETSI